MNINKETAEYTLALALDSWDNKPAAFCILACIMRGEKIPKEVVNLAVHYIERHPANRYTRTGLCD